MYADIFNINLVGYIHNSTKTKKKFRLYLCCWCIGGNCAPKAKKQIQTKIQSSSLLNTSTSNIVNSFPDAYIAENKKFQTIQIITDGGKRAKKGATTLPMVYQPLFFPVAHA